MRSAMLSEKHRSIVSSTVPLLEAGGEQLITYFYTLMLNEHPELRPYFNAAHQADGDQPRALANGVLMYARNIEKLEAMGPLATQIVNKHVALQVQPAHYDIVGKCLLQAIVDVLGKEIATPEVMEAWAAAYAQLAGILIGAEHHRYEEQATAHGGWRGERAFVVVRKEVESEEITSFHLSPADGGAVMDFVPGQYIGMRLWVDGKELRRNYSLSNVPNGSYYRISVKREPGGVASNFLHDCLEVGGTVDLNAPSGAFALQEGTRPIVLISGGVGITPTIPMLDKALTTGRQVIFIHCARSHDVHAFRNVVEQAAARHPQLQHYFCYEQAPEGHAVQPHAVGRIGAAHLDEWLPPMGPSHRDVDVYFLGPKPFMRSVKRHLLDAGVPDAHTHYEFFGPASALQ